MTSAQTTSHTQYRTVVASIASHLGFRHLAGFTLVSTYVLMLLGAYTSAIGAGLSCPDWPTCYGTWIPFLQPEIIANSPYTAWQIFAEWAHRGLAMIVGFLILGTALLAWRRKRDHPVVVWSAILALVLLPIQVTLGQLTVSQLLEPVIVTAHLGIAVLILVSLTTTTLTAWFHDSTDQTSVTAA